MLVFFLEDGKGAYTRRYVLFEIGSILDGRTKEWMDGYRRFWVSSCCCDVSAGCCSRGEMMAISHGHLNEPAGNSIS